MQTQSSLCTVGLRQERGSRIADVSKQTRGGKQLQTERVRWHSMRLKGGSREKSAHSTDEITG